MIKQFLLASSILIASPAVAGPWLVGPQTPTYTDAHPLGAINAAPFYSSGEPADISGGFTTSTWIHTGSPPTVNGGQTAGQYSAPGSGSESKARFDCNIAFENNNDPIIFPGILNGSPHAHTFFGNLDAATNTQNVTYASLRASGNSTCYGGPLNRTLYWEPSMKKVLSSGVAATIKPKNIVTYYESGALADIGTGKITDPLVGTRWPRSLDMVEGFNMADPTNSRVTNIISALNTAAGWNHYSTTPAGTGGGFVGWFCYSYVSGGSAPYLRNTDGTAALNCVSGTDIYAELLSDPCWDGKNPTSPNGRLHMMPFITDNNTGKPVCPDNWYRVMQFRAKVTFAQAGSADYKEWYASSDRMPAMTQFRNGESFHFDLIPAWDYGTAAAPGIFLKFSNHCDGQTVVISGTTMTGDGHECGYGRISLTENLYVNEASPDASSPNPVVNLNPDQTGILKYFPVATGTPVPGPVHHKH